MICTASYSNNFNYRTRIVSVYADGGTSVGFRGETHPGLAPKKATVVVLGITFKENCPDTRNSKVVDIINRLKEYEINPIVSDAWADREVAKHEYKVDLVDFDYENSFYEMLNSIGELKKIG